MLSAPRPLLPSEQEAALDLWTEVFDDTPPEYFARYFNGDSEYRFGDTLGIWDGTTLASAVHLCRRFLDWNGDTILCGGIANVATRPDYRRRGLSRLILREIIAKMERERFHFSLLGTGTHGHYAALGWEQIQRPQYFLPVRSDNSAVDLSSGWQTWGSFETLQPLYTHVPRPLQFVRSPQYFDAWAGWVWRSRSAEMCVTQDSYIVAEFPEANGEVATLLEWKSADAHSERTLLNAAYVEAARRGYSTLYLTAGMQFLDAAVPAELGQYELHPEEGGMIRNVSLFSNDFAQVANAYRIGAAAWWEGDGF